MLVTCTNCGAQLRVPDDALGKSVQCPKCATMFKVPAAGSQPEATSVSATPMPTAPAPADAFSTDPIGADGIAGTPDEGASTPVKQRWGDDDDGDETDDEDFDPLDIRDHRGRRNAKKNGMALASMILGISSLLSAVGSCCNCSFFIYGFTGGVLAIVFGILGKTPGSEGYAWTGILCGSGACLVAVIMLAVGIFAIGMDMFR